MKKDATDKKFMKILKDGNGATFWEDNNTGPFSANEASWELFNDPYFSEAIERFITKNRLAIATSRSRHTLRGLRAKIKALDMNRSSGGLSVDEFSVRV